MDGSGFFRSVGRPALLIDARIFETLGQSNPFRDARPVATLRCRPVLLVGCAVRVDPIELDVAVGYQDSRLDRSGVGRLDQSEWGRRRYFSPVAARWQPRITSGSSASAREISPV
jgi:hypothetical protein